MLELFFRAEERALPPPDHITVGTRHIPLVMVRHPRARRYLLRLRGDGTARVTLPRGGSIQAARQFVDRHLAWLETQLHRLETRPPKPAVCTIGTQILVHGELTTVEPGEAGWIHLGDARVKTTNAERDLRPAIEQHLRKLASRELPLRLMELAGQHRLSVRRVTIRNQRTRWGSCSRRGTISLNWRLIQTPDFVRDYICLHELAHLLEMNHSERFWRQVERLCPDYRHAEHWLKQNAGLLR